MAENINTLVSKLLLRNDSKANWEAKNPTLMKGEAGIEFVDATETAAAQINIKVGDSITAWNDLPYALNVGEILAQIPDVDLSSVTNNVQVEESYAALKDGKAIGDMAIVSTTISGDIKSNTAYVWNGTAWAAMDGNYDADNVYFDSNLTMTTAIGVQGMDGKSSRELATAGKSLKQVFSMILAKEAKPSKSDPYVTTKISNGADSTPADSAIKVEGGTTITPKWSASFNKGSYTYGPDTGITPTAWEVKGYIGSTAVAAHTSTEKSGTFDPITLAAGQSYKINAKASYEAGPIAYTNLGNEYKAGNALFDETTNASVVQIAKGSKNDDSQTITAWQQGYYIGTLESDVEITSALLRNTNGKGVLKNRTVKNSDYAAATDLKFSPTSDKMAKFVIAYPAAKDMTNGVYDSKKGLQSFFNNSSFEEYFGNFTRSVVKVAGADGDATSSYAVDYAVWTWTPASAFSGTINFLIDLK